MNLERLNRVTIEEGKCGDRPCIRGLRIRVVDVLELLSAGASVEEVLADYPFLEREDILAAIEYGLSLQEAMRDRFLGPVAAGLSAGGGRRRPFAARAAP